MIRKILLTLDGSAYSRAVYDSGVWLGGKLQARLTAAHVVDVISMEGPFLHDLSGSLGFEPFLNFSSKMKEVLEERGENILKGFREESVKDRIELDTRLLSGVVPNEICEKAELYDLVVVGRKGVNAAFEHGLLGSATESVIRKSPVPVLVVPEEFKAPQSALLAYDGSPNAAGAMRSAADLCESLEVPLTVCTASDDSAVAGNALKDAEDYLNPHGVRAEFIRLEGEGADSIVEYCKEKDFGLIFMGTSHHSAVVRMVLGSTTEHVMRALEVPFFLHR